MRILTVVPVEYDAVHSRLDKPDLYQGKTANLFAWETSELLSTSGAVYRVVHGMSGQPGQVSSSELVAAAIRHWNPSYVILVRIAGGFPLDGLQKGDVALSATIYGYEYGKLDSEGFKPRHNWVYNPDRALLTSALRIQITTPQWSASITPWPEGVPHPKAVSGNIASGDKLVDGNPQFFKDVQGAWEKLLAVEMEGAGAAKAIEFARAEKKPVAGFFMVRGISDMPPVQDGQSPGSGSAQSSQRDNWKQYAASAAAEFVIRWIRETWPVAPRDQGPTIGTPPSPQRTSSLREVNSFDLAAEVAEDIAKLPKDPSASDHQRELIWHASRMFQRPVFRSHPDRHYGYGLYAVILTRLAWDQEVLPRLNDKNQGNEVVDRLLGLEDFMAKACKLDGQKLDRITADGITDKHRFVSMVGYTPPPGDIALEEQRTALLRGLGEALKKCSINCPVGSPDRYVNPADT